MKQTCILILGMHRSGTSALTGLLSMCDVYLGSELMAANFANEKGYFENNKICKLNENLLLQIDSSWDDVFFNEQKLEKITSSRILKDLIETEFKYCDIFAIKDPRLVFLFPVYIKILNELNINVKIIIPYRNPLEVASSLAKRNAFCLEKSMTLWACHMLLAEKFTRKFPREFVCFNALMKNPEMIINSISKNLKLALNKKYLENKEEIHGFIEPSLKHHNISFDNLSSNIPSIVAKILQLRDKYNSKEITKEFDPLVHEFFSYQKLFYNEDLMTLFVEHSNVKIRLQETEQELQERVAESQKLQKNLHVKEAQWQEALKSKAILQEELEKEQSKLCSLKNELISIHTGVSWKITRPLRKIKRFFR